MKITSQAAAIEVTIAISEYEAEVLAFVCTNIGGDPSLSPRGVFDDLRKGLLASGIKERSFPLHDGYFDSIIFAPSKG